MDKISQPTLSLCQHVETLRKHPTVVTSVRTLETIPEADRALFKDPPENATILTVAETIFYAQGGGQPSDVGSISSTSADAEPASLDVTAVRNSSTYPGQVLHLGRPSGPTSRPFAPPEPVRLEIDGATRALHNRLHTGGHLLGLAIRRLMGRHGVPVDLVEGKASHFPGQAAVECSGSIPGTAKEPIQRAVDEIVASGADVHIRDWMREECLERGVAGIEEFLELGKLKEGEKIRVVDVEGIGSYPCGGTHVKKADGVGKVIVKKISRSKGTSRVSYDVQ